ncbi:Response regulator [Congregibacter litoralis KT71]|uniref:diguanylate cyclase n=1 Tax=Congregibacter litoralis KT71 TaxID=314285 RepID=V7HV16_9GAMM|nr:Response regulator [Congregibacter litoralis KT71]
MIADREIPKLGDRKITASIGVAQLRDDDESLDHAIQRADAALYSAKHSGRNCWRSC